MRQISKIHFTTEGEVSNYFFSKKKFETGTKKPTTAFQRGNKRNMFISSLKKYGLNL